VELWRSLLQTQKLIDYKDKNSRLSSKEWAGGLTYFEVSTNECVILLPSKVEESNLYIDESLEELDLV
jgi:hypothetical protein